MRLSDFDFDLPEELIATRPVSPRSSARLLLADGGAISDKHVFDLPEILREGDLLVTNNTKVLQARLKGHRQRGDVKAGIEVTLLEPRADGTWMALLKPLRKVNEGEVITFSDTFSAQLISKTSGQAALSFNLSGEGFDAALLAHGTMPLPPYIASRRASDARDLTDYQTVFAKHQGAVAAPTASLHFDDTLLQALSDKGVDRAEVTLHVGAGTFLPVKVEDVTTHKMHAEWGEVSNETAQKIHDAKKEGRRVIAVGTTALRVLEAAALSSGTIQLWAGKTDIFIYPGFDFRVVDGLMTNFHLPKSTLMMLVSALMGKSHVDEIYAHAIARKYRFFSYGDSSLLIP